MHTDSHDTPTPEIDERRREIALFRYGVIADLVHLEPHHRGLYALLAKKAELDYTIPGSLRRHVAPETMRGWLRAYRQGGFDALAPRVRADQGSTRSIPMHVVDLLCQMKEDSPELSIPALIKVARADHAHVVTDEVALPESTVHRVLARRGLMKKQPEEPTSKDRRRFEHESAGDLWMSDDSENRLTVVLVGHPELRRRMSMAALDALAQRVVVRAHVRGLTREEMGPYLAHRLHLAASDVPLFEPPTVEAIFQASSGLPRKANGLAHHALFAAAIAKAKSVTTEHVQAAMQEVA